MSKKLNNLISDFNFNSHTRAATLNSTFGTTTFVPMYVNVMFREPLTAVSVFWEFYIWPSPTLFYLWVITAFACNPGSRIVVWGCIAWGKTAAPHKSTTKSSDEFNRPAGRTGMGANKRSKGSRQIARGQITKMKLMNQFSMQSCVNTSLGNNWIKISSVSEYAW